MGPEFTRTERLLRGWHDGDRAALMELVGRDAEWIAGRIRRRRQPALAQHVETLDQFQDLMVDVLQYAPRFLVRDRAAFRALLARMIENDLIDKQRYYAGRRAEPWQSETCLSLDPGIEPPTSPGEHAQRSEELAWMRIGIELLDDDDRHLVRRRAFEEASFVELETELGASAHALNMRYRRILARLTGIIRRLERGELAALVGAGGGEAP